MEADVVYEILSRYAPIDKIKVPDPLTKATWVITYNAAATGGELAAAATALAAINPGDAQSVAPLMKFDCMLVGVGTLLQLYRLGSGHVFIQGANRPVGIGSDTPDMFTTALTVDTVYHIYAYWDGLFTQIEASTTAPTQDATYGHAIKTGDASRTFVGTIRTYDVLGDVSVADNVFRRFVASYYHRQNKPLERIMAADRAPTPSNSLAEVNSGDRVEFVALPPLFGGEVITAFYGVSVASAAEGNVIGTAIALDGSQLGMERAIHVPVAGYANDINDVTQTYPTVGYHYLSLFARTSDLAQLTFNGTHSSIGAMLRQ